MAPVHQTEAGGGGREGTESVIGQAWGGGGGRGQRNVMAWGSGSGNFMTHRVQEGFHTLAFF
jgi:hypothetical protein